MSLDITLTDRLAVELDRIFTQPCDTHELLDDALRAFLAVTTEAQRKSMGVDGEI